MAKLFLHNNATNKDYEVVRFDQEKNEIVLRGPNSEFAEPFDKERLKRLGYNLVQKEA